MLTRRDVLQKCVALGSVVIASQFSPEAMLAAFQDREKQVRQPTPPNELGPFYKRLTPVNNMLRAPGDPGMPLTLFGQVFDTRGDIVPGATIEIWQTNHHGHYDLNGYRYRGKLNVDKSGAYSFESVVPGHYPDRICQHTHYLVMAPGHKAPRRWSLNFISQLIPSSKATPPRTTRAIRCSKHRSSSAQSC